MFYIFLNVLCEEAATGGLLLKKLLWKISQIQSKIVSAMEFSWNYGTLINIHLQHKKDGPYREKFRVFPSRKT